MLDYKYAKDGWNYVVWAKDGGGLYAYGLPTNVSLKFYMKAVREDIESGDDFYSRFNTGYCLLTRREGNE